MLNLDPAKLLVILVLGLIVIGPERLPRVAHQLATVWRTLSTYREQAETEIRKAIPYLDLPRIPRSPSSAVSSFLTSLTTSNQPSDVGVGAMTTSTTATENTTPATIDHIDDVDAINLQGATQQSIDAAFEASSDRAAVAHRVESPEMN